MSPSRIRYRRSPRHFARLGDAPSAMRASERAIDIYSQRVSPDDERILSATNLLAVAAIDAGDLRRARTEFEQLLPRIERSLGSNHRNYAAVLGNLAILRLELGEYEGVEQQLRRVSSSTSSCMGRITAASTCAGSRWVCSISSTGRLSESIAISSTPSTVSDEWSGPATGSKHTRCWASPRRCVHAATSIRR